VTGRLLLLLLVAVLGGCASTGGARSTQYQKPDIVPIRQAAEPNALLGIEYMKAGQVNQAMDHLQRALVHDPDLPLAHNAIAVLYEQLGEHDRAEAHFRRVVTLAPKDSDAWNNYGRFLCTRERYPEATDAFTHALDNPLYRTPENSFTNLGHCALRNGEKGLAEHYFRQALGKKPDFPPALMQMARLSWEEGNALQARAYLQRLLARIRPTPEVLWLGVQVERQLGNRSAADSYALQLRERFPTSPETRLLLASEKQ
jgi:type IV pilus assembly protein PilF